MTNSMFPTDQPPSTSIAFCPSCGSKMESKMVRQLFSIWTAGDESEKDPFQMVERVVCHSNCSVCGYEEYEPPAG
jgi:hypothetical protein